MTEAVVLPDTSLCAIVRDEIMNPAGGIKRFVDSHVPFVEEAVIVDTGSVDGTREALEELQSKYPNLRVFDHPFKDYSDARNYSLRQVKTKRALVLDADELLTHERPQDDFRTLRNFMEENPSGRYHFNFLQILPNGDLANLMENGLRVFEVSGDVRYDGRFCESIPFFSFENPLVIGDKCKIKHFLPNGNGILLKKDNWYWGADFTKSPSEVKGFEQWKQYNPQRDNFE